MNRFPNRRWMVIPTSITGSINFSEVLESGPDTLRISTDGSQTFVKYEITEVAETYTETFIDPETNQEVTNTVQAGIYSRPSIYLEEYPEYTHPEILSLLTGSNWIELEQE